MNLFILIDPYLKTKVLLTCIKNRKMQEIILNDPPFDYFNPESKDPIFSRFGKSINPITYSWYCLYICPTKMKNNTVRIRFCKVFLSFP